MRPRVALLRLCALLVACTGCSSTAFSTTPGAPTVQDSSRTITAASTAVRTNVRWIVSESGITNLETVMAFSRVRALFDNANTYEIMNEQSKPDPLPLAKHVLYYRDETLIAADLKAGKFASMDGALYDDEAYVEPGNTTPDAQKLNPVPYAQNAAKILHAAKKLFVYTIGSATGPAGAFWSTTLPHVAPYPDVIDFQTQAAEGTASFAQQVAHYSASFRPYGKGLMLVGIGADPKGETKSAADIESAYDAGLANEPPVDGFWINMAVRSASCTGCSANPDPQPIASFLQLLNT